MTHANRIDGKAIAAELRERIKARTLQLKQEHNLTPGLAVVLVGDDPASEVYVRNKGKQTKEAGMQSFEYALPSTTSEEELLRTIDELNNHPEIHGILVQLPLPKHIDEAAIINSIAPQKDVDGFHVVNMGRLVTGQDSIVPCTPLGCWFMLKRTLGDLTGKHAVVIGRSNIVGKPMAHLLLQSNCTVTLTHSRTKDLEGECKRADIIVAAVGVEEMVRGSWIKPGAVVIDVGINRVATSDGKHKLVGDVHYDEAASVASAITPVPGGVGPMTIACLLHNTLEVACKQHNIAFTPLVE